MAKVVVPPPRPLRRFKRRPLAMPRCVCCRRPLKPFQRDLCSIPCAAERTARAAADRNRD